MRFQDRVVLVTGGASRQGEATCRLFAAEGARVVVAYWDADGAEKVAHDIGGEPFAVNVAQESEVAEMIAFACSRFGRLDVLFNNAGVRHSATGRFRMASIVDTPEDAWDAILDINLKGQAMGCKYAIPQMVAAGGGVIINNASIMAIAGVPGADAYTAAKGGVVALTRVLAVEWASYGIRVNCICPGTIATPMVGSLIDNADGRARLADATPMKRIGISEEIARVAVFLASSDASYINGAFCPSTAAGRPCSAASPWDGACGNNDITRSFSPPGPKQILISFGWRLAASSAAFCEHPRHPQQMATVGVSGALGWG